MKIYKLKDLSDDSKCKHFLQIILQRSIWCARPDSLNDPDEFRFKLDYAPSIRTAGLLSKVIEQYRIKYRTNSHRSPYKSAQLALQEGALENIARPIVENIVNNCRNSMGITSFSAIKEDDQLWIKYGGNGNGACIEIDIPDSLFGLHYHSVYYVNERIFHVDCFLESALRDDNFEIYKNILLTKTRKWCNEKEIRFVGDRQEVNLVFDGQVTEITFGNKVPHQRMDQLMTSINNHCKTNGIEIIFI